MFEYFISTCSIVFLCRNSSLYGGYKVSKFIFAGGGAHETGTFSRFTRVVLFHVPMFRYYNKNRPLCSRVLRAYLDHSFYK